MSEQRRRNREKGERDKIAEALARENTCPICGPLKPVWEMGEFISSYEHKPDCPNWTPRPF